MTTKRQPYIGVTGFTAPTEVDEVLAAVPHGSPRLLMVGVLASRRSLRGEPSKKYPGRYPPREQIAKIFPEDRRALNLVHYHAPGATGLAAELEGLRAIGGPRLHGVQLNIAWPDPDALHALDGLRIVLQLSRQAMDACAKNPAAIAGRVADYGDRIHDVLIDPSGGTGGKDGAFDAGFAANLATAIRNLRPDLGIGVAGGLHAKNLTAIHPLLPTVPDVSIDAEGGLRDGWDRLVLTATKAYVAAGFALFADHPSSASLPKPPARAPEIAAHIGLVYGHWPGRGFFLIKNPADAGRGHMTGGRRMRSIGMGLPLGNGATGGTASPEGKNPIAR